MPNNREIAEAMDAHTEEFQIMYSMLLDNGATAHDARCDAVAWARLSAPYPGMKDTDCADEGQCCYNALSNTCEDPYCYCHTYDPTNIEAPF